MFKRDFDDTYFDTYEEAAEAAKEDFDMTDFIDYGELRDYDKNHRYVRRAGKA